VEPVRLGPLAAAADPVIYYHANQLAETLAYRNGVGAGIAIRAGGNPYDLASFIRERSRAIDPTAPVYNLRTLDEQIGESVAQPRFLAVVLGLFAALALSTALLGIYGVLAYSVERRHVEFGIRRALGASEQQVVALVAERALTLAGIGLTIGLAAGAIGSRLMHAVLFGVTPADPTAYAGAGAAVAVIVVAASWRPARRALRIDPAQALRLDA
jgi:ABC-type antimicrobial peptide transport system permease subunit